MHPVRLRSPLVLIVAVLFALISVAPTVSAQRESGQSKAKFDFQFVACGPGGDESGPPDDCKNDVAPPDEATLQYGQGTYARFLDVAEEHGNGYRIDLKDSDLADGGAIYLENFDHPDYNYYTFDGVDTVSRWRGDITDLSKNHKITVIYWNGANGPIMPAENNVTIDTFTCGEGVDPVAAPDACEPADASLVDDGATRQLSLDNGDLSAYRSVSGNTISYANLPSYTEFWLDQPFLEGYEQSFVVDATSGTSGDAVEHAFLLRNEVRNYNLYFSAPNGEVSQATAPPATDASDGTLKLALHGCPRGVVPEASNLAQCTETITDNGSITVTFADGSSAPLNSFPVDNGGTYTVTGPAGPIAVTGLEPVEYDRVKTDGAIDGNTVTWTTTAGETTDGNCYYYFEP